jgi:hypothetical protein
MYKDYLKKREIENFNIETVKKFNSLFKNEEELFKLLKIKEFKAYNIELADVIRNNELLEFLRTKYIDISNQELAKLTEFLFVSDLDELNKLNKDEMLNRRKEFNYVRDEIWSQFIEDIGLETNIFLYQYAYECFDINEVIQQNKLSHILRPIGENLLIEYNDSWINYFDSKVKLIGLIPFNIYILGFNKESNNYNFSNESIKDYINNIELLWFIHNDLGYSTLLVNKNISI